MVVTHGVCAQLWWSFATTRVKRQFKLTKKHAAVGYIAFSGIMNVYFEESFVTAICRFGLGFFQFPSSPTLPCSVYLSGVCQTVHSHYHSQLLAWNA